MDTFNFSFFEDDPNAPKKSAQDKTNDSASAVPSNKSDAEADPFGFDAFDPHVNDATEPNAPAEALSFDLGNSGGVDLDFESPVRPETKETTVTPASDNFPDLALDPTDVEMGGTEATEPEFDMSLVADAPRASESKNDVDASDVLALDSDNDFSLDMEGDDALALDPSDLPPLEPESEPIHVEPAPPEEPQEIRAAVEPAVFLVPAPVSDSPEPEPPAQAKPVASEPAMSRERAAKPTRYLTADDPFGEVTPPRERLRVAILGASGIGKNHARWFAKHSCDVVSFLGSSGESVDLTRSHLNAHMGFVGEGFTDLGKLIAQSQPQAVCIASPPELHYAQAMQCLEAGLHVLCEKPLVYDKNQSREENVQQASELQEFAYQNSQMFAPQLQYGAATPILCRLAGISPYEVGDFAMEAETTNARASRDPKELWIDLAPHALSVAQYLGGEGAELVEDMVQLMPSRSAYTTEVSARFGVRCDGGRLLMCRAIVRCFDKIVDNREPRRRFAFNGRVVQYSGVKSPDGTFIAQYVAPDGYISHYSDPVDYLIGNFVRSCWGEDELLVSGAQGVQNLDWLLAMSQKL